VPTYSYACKDCGHAFDIQQAFTDDSLTACPECTGPLRKVFSAVGVVFKGSGFYRNDSRGSGPSGSGKDGGTKDSGAKGTGPKGSGSTEAGGKSGAPKDAAASSGAAKAASSTSSGGSSSSSTPSG
jgi:putative FmdB family regulatory protein